VPGTTTPITDASEIIAFGDEFGYPIAIKAAYGGGGRGMKVVESADDAEPGALESRARGAGVLRPPECYIERYLTRPRHVELQVFATRTATACTSATATARPSAATRS
jgi:acetyl-CoA/propionyl-CoA carboxylase biotin carboxyl carrier protein